MIKSALIVEDNESDLHLATISLKGSKLFEEIHTAENGRQALDFFMPFIRGTADLSKVSPPQLVFLDLYMPVMDGFEFMEAFRPYASMEVFRDTRVVVCTYSDHKDDRTRALSYPFVAHFFVKPFSPLKVKEVARVLNLH